MGGIGFGFWGVDVVGEEVFEVGHGVVGESGQDFSDVSERVHIVPLAAHYNTVKSRRRVSALGAYVPAMERYGLPKFQYTIREVPTGGTWFAYGNELSMAYATAALRRFLEHLSACGVDLSEVRIQTDWGSEYDGASRTPKEHGFIRTLEGAGAQHRPAPPGCPNANADVETIHATIEDEFFNLERFTGREDFLRKVTTYQHWYNLIRKNGSKGWRTPLDILREKTDEILPAVLLLSPIILDDYPDTTLPRQDLETSTRISGVDMMYPSLTCLIRTHP